MSNPANKFPSYESVTVVQDNSNYFCLPMGCTPAEIKHNQVVIKKDIRGEEGSKQFISNLS